MAATLQNPLCTIAEVQTEIGNSDSSLTDRITAAINDASRLIEAYKGRTYASISYVGESYLTIRTKSPDCVLFLDGTTFMVPVSHAPVQSIDSLTEDGVTLTENTDFYIDKTIGLVQRSSGKWGDVIQIQGTFGFSGAASTPPDDYQLGNIRIAAIKIAANLTGKNVRESTSAAAGKTSIIDKTVFTDDVVKLLGPRKFLV